MKPPGVPAHNAIIRSPIGSVWGGGSTLHEFLDRAQLRGKPPAAADRKGQKVLQCLRTGFDSTRPGDAALPARSYPHAQSCVAALRIARTSLDLQLCHRWFWQRCRGDELRGVLAHQESLLISRPQDHVVRRVWAYNSGGAAQDQPISFEEESGTLSMRWTVGDGFIKVPYLNNRRFHHQRDPVRPEHPPYQPGHI